MNNGKKFEIEFVNYINNKHLKDINDNMKKFIKFTFNDICENDIIKCYRLNSVVKPDIKLIVNNKVKYVSLKTGSENSIHIEKLEGFLNFLKKLNIDSSILNIIRYYHFGDDTLDGTGAKRFDANALKIKYQLEIKKLNIFINKKEYLKPIIERFLFSGSKYNRKTVDILYYGNLNYGIWCTKEEIISYLINKPSLYIDTPHFSSLTLQNWSRNINFKKASEERRYYIQIKWFSIVSDMEKIRSR